MAIGIEGVIWYIVLIDAIGANITAWFFQNWYRTHTKWWAKHFPMRKGWAAYYLILVLWIGYGLYRMGVLY